MALFDIGTDRRASRLTDEALGRCRQIVDRLKWLSPIEGFLLLKEIELLKRELNALKAKAKAGL